MSQTVRVIANQSSTPDSIAVTVVMEKY